MSQIIVRGSLNAKKLFVEHRNNLKISFLIRKFQKFIFVNLLISPKSARTKADRSIVVGANNYLPVQNDGIQLKKSKNQLTTA